MPIPTYVRNTTMDNFSNLPTSLEILLGMIWEISFIYNLLVFLPPSYLIAHRKGVENETIRIATMWSKTSTTKPHNSRRDGKPPQRKTHCKLNVKGIEEIGLGMDVLKHFIDNQVPRTNTSCI